MTRQEQITILKELIEGVTELNGEFQSGWDEDIANGERLLKFIESQEPQQSEPQKGDI